MGSAEGSSIGQGLYLTSDLVAALSARSLPWERECMFLGQVLPRSEGPAICRELVELRSAGPVEVRGVHQDHRGRSIRQFQFSLDEATRSWSMQRENDSEQWFEDGVLHNTDGAVPIAFERSLPMEVRMAIPERFLWWGRTSEELAPMLVQRVGQHSILVTFEHNADPAVRTTMVLDERDGIARRRFDIGEATVVTEVRRARESRRLPLPEFTPLTTWIATDY